MNISDGHTVKNFDSELARLGDELYTMGEIACGQIQAAADALVALDADAADRVVADDPQLDRIEAEIGHDVLRLLALRQPVAHDLREVLAALRIAAVVERIGDYAKNVAKRTRAVCGAGEVPEVAMIPPLAKLAIDLLRDALRAYVKRDVALALAVRERDAELDAEFSRVFEVTLASMQKHPERVTVGAHLLFMAKNFERIGDHVTSIAENIWFIEQGEAELEARAKRDRTAGLGA